MDFYRRLGDEMRNMSIEKSRQREHELQVEMERLQAEIETMQKAAKESANISQQLSKEVCWVFHTLHFDCFRYFYVNYDPAQVQQVEEKVVERKAEVEKLIKEMREANMESLAISPPEESKQFLDGNTFGNFA